MQAAAFALPTGVRWTWLDRLSASVKSEVNKAVSTVEVLAICAGAWGLLMAISPVLQIRQMWMTQSSKDVSLGYFGVMLPGFLLWIAYGSARQDWALVVPNVVAFLVACTTMAVARYLRRRLPHATPADQLTSDRR